MWLLLAAGCLINDALYEERKDALTDHDGDGIVKEDDCDDADPSVFPGADEHCDDRDEDCDGEIDEHAVDPGTWFMDADGDSFGDAGAPILACDAPAGAVADSSDCDDGAAEVNPGEEEIPYDGIDNDCVGGDETDADGDGYPYGSDCDDGDGAVHPGAAEVAYDGVDQDCSGSDLDDLDGDGVAAAEAGGGDCDDGDATIAAGVEETWDDGYTDNDCDGELEEVTVVYGGSPWLGRSEEAWLGRRLAALGDTDGDGRSEFVASALGESGTYAHGGEVYLLTGEAGGSIEGVPTLTALAAESWLGTGLAGGSDVDGDGVPDVIVGATGVDDGAGAAWVVGGVDLVGTQPVDVAASKVVWGDDAASYAGSAVAFVGDVMGDGASWIGVSAPLANVGGYVGAGRVGLFDPRSLTEASLADADILVDGYYDSATAGNDVAGIGDLNGDGYDDYLISFGYGDLAAVLPGGKEDPTVLDDAIFRLTGTGEGETGTTQVVGDVDGDGGADLVAILNEDEVYFLVHLLDAPLVTARDAVSQMQLGAGSYAYQAVNLGDLDGDTRAETLLPAVWYLPLDNSAAAIVPGASVEFGADLLLEDQPLIAVAARNGAYGYRAIVAGDADGDGHEELAIGGYQEDGAATDAGGVTTIPVPH